MANTEILKFSITLLFILFTTPLLTSTAWASPACARFRVHLAKELPDQQNHQDFFNSLSLPHELESAIVTWKNKITFLKDETESKRWLHCIRQFIFLDTDQDGLSDWSAVVDGRPSKVLFPLDPDIDGDGLPNLFDPNPYGMVNTLSSKLIPPHLRMQGEKGFWQEKLWLDLGVVAVDHTDEHLADILAITYAILQLESLRNWKHEVRGFSALYAFRNRNLNLEIAAYHPSAYAISVPGKESFMLDQLSISQKCKYAAAFIHELGHALLFATVKVNELREKAVLVGWNLPRLSPNDIYSPTLLSPMKDEKKSFVSDYAKTNVHEWFAESFAAYIWQKEFLKLQYCQAFKDEFISKEFRGWMDVLLVKAEGINPSLANEQTIKNK